MLLLEQDAKSLLAERGVRVPRNVRAGEDGSATAPDFAPPFVVKAQVPVGGRGKAGGIRIVREPDRTQEACRAILGMTIKGHRVRSCLIEEAVDGRETYLSYTLDPVAGAVRILFSPQGGIDVESASEQVHQTLAAPDADDLDRALGGLLARDAVTAALSPSERAAAAEAGAALGRAFLALEAALLEINPLFLLPGGGYRTGDAKLVIDANALPRQPETLALMRADPPTYADILFKVEHGFDLVVVDPQGDIGLVTTGAGLSMKLIDELVANGMRPYNFCDIRSGQMRGDPTRLIEALRRMEQAKVRCVLVNIFAGITDLGEFADLLIRAAGATPGLPSPIVVRLVGNGEDRADALLRASGLDVVIEPELDRAVLRAVAVARSGDA